MRLELLQPLRDNPFFKRACALVELIYACRRSGTCCDDALEELNSFSNYRLQADDFVVDPRDEVLPPEELAFGLVLHLIPTPIDLSYDEMLSLVGRLKAHAAEDGLQAAYWEKCLEVNTGDPNFSQLLQGGAELYFRDGVSRWLSAKEILDTALAASGRLGADKS